MEYEEESLGLGIAIFVVSLMGIIVVTAVVFGLWDLRRFGRGGAPWRVGLMFAGIFGSFCFWQFGFGGLLVGLACIWAFESGRKRYFTGQKPSAMRRKKASSPMELSRERG